MSTLPADDPRITRVLEVLDSSSGSGKIAIEFEAGSRAGTLIVTTDRNGRHSLCLRDHAPAALAPDPPHSAEVLSRAAGDQAGGESARATGRPEPCETEVLRAQCDAILRRSMKLLALPVHSY